MDGGFRRRGGGVTHCYIFAHMQTLQRREEGEEKLVRRGRKEETEICGDHKEETTFTV